LGSSKQCLRVPWKGGSAPMLAGDGGDHRPAGCVAGVRADYAQSARHRTLPSLPASFAACLAVMADLLIPCLPRYGTYPGYAVMATPYGTQLCARDGSGIGEHYRPVLGCGLPAMLRYLGRRRTRANARDPEFSRGVLTRGGGLLWVPASSPLRPECRVPLPWS